METDWGNRHLCHHTVLVTLIRKPLLLLLAGACAASLAASGRFSLRLLFDTSIALAIIPLGQVLAFSVVYWTGRRPARFSPAVDAYCDGFWPWFMASAFLGMFGAFSSPIVAAGWFSRVGIVCAVTALVVSLRIDWRYSRELLGRGTRRAVADVVVQRAIGWSITLVYMLLTAAPKAGSFLPDITSNLVGPRP
jgi:hypothetical protein